MACDETRQQLRRLHKSIRAQMDAAEAEEKSAAICRRFFADERYERTQVIFGYYPIGREVDCRAILRQALLDGKTVALPRTEADCRMDFYQVASLEMLTEGSFHVLEPSLDCPLVTPEEAVILVPGVVFDKKGNRYGYGKGYYDRYFARFLHAERIALAYENQLEDEIQTLSTDIRMHGVYTERAAYYFEKIPFKPTL